MPLNAPSLLKHLKKTIYLIRDKIVIQDRLNFEWKLHIKKMKKYPGFLW